MSNQAKLVSPGGGPFKISAAGLTDRGRVRENNEDVFSLNSELGLYLVADGMGGVQGGQAVATSIARAFPAQLAAFYREHPPHNQKEMARLFGEALASFSDEILARSATNPALRGAGAAIVACWINDGDAALAFMGDCRAYLLRDGNLKLLTSDHTIAALLLKLNKIDEKEASLHPGRHALTCYVGMEPAALPETAALDLHSSDRLLLCSDGLWGTISEDQLVHHLSTDRGLDSICTELVKAANNAGGPDNITAVVIRVDSPAPAGQVEQGRQSIPVMSENVL